MIQVQSLTKHYGPVTAIRDVTFDVAPGQIVGFLGPNGAGKTTTMRILACFMPASGGSARVAGHDVFTESMEVRRRIGYLPENVPLYQDMRVGPYLDFVAEVKGVSRADRRGRVADVMDRCRIADVQNRLIGKLSKGYRQRVGLAQAIVSDPDVLILDEPTIGLDPRQITEIRSLIKSLAGDHTVILSTHILPEVSMVCSGVIIINKGAIVAQGPIDTLVEQFFPTSRVLIEIASPPRGVRDWLSVIPGVTFVSDDAPNGATATYVVESERDRDVRSEIFRLAAQQKWDLLELRRVGMTLEEVFIRIVAGEESMVGDASDHGVEVTEGAAHPAAASTAAAPTADEAPDADDEADR
jgi:gliding motility-associated transport system ATP-binding protein